MDNLEYLLEKLGQDNLSDVEGEQLVRYFNIDNLSELKELLNNDWKTVVEENQKLDPVKSQLLWQAIQRNKNKPTTTIIKRLDWKRATAIAASILLIVTSILLLLKRTNINFQPQVVAWTESTNNQEAPALILLEDGSKVWLKQGSQLRYPKRFSSSLRPIELIGEAFFEVTKDPSRPFVVKTKFITTNVLGTAFNIRAYEMDTLISVALAEGSISVETSNSELQERQKMLLKPSEKLEYVLASRQFRKSTFGGNLPYAWKDSIIHFDGASVKEVTSVLMKRYKIQIEIPEDLYTDSRLVHRFDATKSSISEALKGIAKVTGYHFEKVNEKKYIVRLD
ncbi:MAG: FecR domain-containing protein [Bacteroidota bacterium]